MTANFPANGSALSVINGSCLSLSSTHENNTQQQIRASQLALVKQPGQPDAKVARKQTESVERRTRTALTTVVRNSTETGTKPTLAASDNGDFYIYKLEYLNLQKVLEKEKADREEAQHEV